MDRSLPRHDRTCGARARPGRKGGAVMSCEIIQISAFTRPARPASDKHPPAEATAIGSRLLTPRQRRREGKPELPPPATETAKNSRIRTERRDAWWHACRVTEYWRTRV